jgi:hypothetical protein
MKIQHSTVYFLICGLAASFCLQPLAQGQSGAPTAAAQPQTRSVAETGPDQSEPANPQPSATGQSQTQKPPVVGGPSVNPSQPPLQPVTTYPDAAGGQQPTPDAPQPKTQQNSQLQNEPQGAATAEKVPTAGGAAAKPAGVAIAPPKQHQARSLLIKLGAVAAGAVAAGTIFALSRGTSSTPPGAGSPGTVQKRSR